SALNPTAVDRATWTYDTTYPLTREHRTGTNSFVVTHTYDAAGNRLVKNDGGSRTTSTYDAANRMVISQASTGRTTYTYNVDGMLRREVAPAGAITTSVWDSDGMPRYLIRPAPIGLVPLERKIFRLEQSPIDNCPTWRTSAPLPAATPLRRAYQHLSRRGGGQRFRSAGNGGEKAPSSSQASPPLAQGQWGAAEWSIIEGLGGGDAVSYVQRKHKVENVMVNPHSPIG
ncbi:MAG: hypothetical protein ACKV0T_26595, partial [Planctomycetales bacterium]